MSAVPVRPAGRISETLSTPPAIMAGTPSMTMRPEVGARWPEMMLTSVDLPAPFSPRRPWIVPRRMRNDTPRSAVTGPKVRVTFSIDRIVSGSSGERAACAG